MNGRAALGLAVLAGAAAGGAAVWATDAVPGRALADRGRTEQVVHDYLISHPEVITEAMQRLDERRVADALGAERKAIETPFAGAWAGAHDADVTLVEFTDYACGYCRRTVPDLDRLLAEDRHLKIVWREIPILSAESDTAARVALAAAQAGRYNGVHHALFSQQLSGDSVAEAARTAAIPAGAADAAPVRGEIANNLALAERLGINATPTFVIGDKLLAGAIGYDALKQAVADARKARG